ncbi:LysR family transcriptional regulator [Photorhabdus caribbeanensis]|uniref:LysR family transcriptional regulator n=1 Tax=Photorhabdus caribbeanensis TaxID=1004165 RepID=UPI001BD56EE9|nr:LysR family transcriptional regulator [Photorhabdus caribbeanensis]MBS9425206.1 LysR family transcriptional regulator [Photorhabdus caribbeanensis]
MQNHLNRIQTFLSVVDCGSFTRAAESLFISKAMASIHVKSLEEELDVPLLLRNTRGIALTEAGKNFYNDFKEIFNNIQNAFDNVAERHHSLAGALRITATPEFGEKFLLPLIGEFCKIYPQLEISYFAGSSLNDLIAERLDLAIRLGTLRDSTLKSRRLTSYAIQLVASPGWLEQHQLKEPSELNNVDWIANNNLQAPTQWDLGHPTLPTISIRGKARYTSNSSEAIRSMALSKLGVAVLPEWMVRDDLMRGDLVQLFPNYQLPEQAVTIIFPNNARMQRKSRIFIDYLLENLRI